LSVLPWGSRPRVNIFRPSGALCIFNGFIWRRVVCQDRITTETQSPQRAAQRKFFWVVSGTRSRCCNAWPTNHPAPTMGDPLCPSLCPLCLCASDYSESLQEIGLRCVGAGYIPPLSVDVPLNAQGRHKCRPYSTLASSVVGAGFIPARAPKAPQVHSLGREPQERQQSKNHKAAERRQIQSRCVRRII